MHKFRNEEGLTLIELLITLAVTAVVFAIAVPVFSNVLAVAEADADAAQQAALASFAREYATTTLSYDSASNTTTATLNGDVIATIKGNATASVQPVAEYVYTGTITENVNPADGRSVWSAEYPVLMTGYALQNFYVSVARAQFYMAYGTKTVLPDNTVQVQDMDLVTYRYLSAAPTAGNGAQILPLG